MSSVQRCKKERQQPLAGLLEGYQNYPQPLILTYRLHVQEPSIITTMHQHPGAAQT